MNQLELRRLFDYQDGKLLWKEARRGGRGIKAGDVAGTPHAIEKRQMIRIARKLYYRNRLVWEYFNGPIPEGMEIDHINCERSDDRIENLRLATRRQNARNMPKRDRDLPKNVRKFKNGYQVKVAKGDGKFRTKNTKSLENAEVYAKLFRLRYHGEFAHG